MRNQNKPLWRSTREIAVGRKRVYETLTKPRFIWLYNFINKLCDNLIDLAFKVKRLNRKYNEIKYQKIRYKTIYKTEYI